MKKVIGIVIALVIVIAAICGIVYMVNKDSLSGNKQESLANKEMDENVNTNTLEENNVIENEETTKNGERFL